MRGPPVRSPLPGSCRRGIALAEVIVALTLLAIVLAGVVATHQMALHRWNRALVRTRVQLDLRAAADSVDRGWLGGEGGVERPWGRIHRRAAGPGVELVAVDRSDTLVLARLWTGGPGGGS